jgi:hypothetical protein
MLHGKNIDWVKVSSSLSQDEGSKTVEKKDLFKK